MLISDGLFLSNPDRSGKPFLPGIEAVYLTFLKI